VSTEGTVEQIAIAAEHPQLPVPVPSVRAEAGHGLAGEYHWSETPEPGQSLTLIAAEALEGLREDTGIELSHEASRRNVLTRGIDLNALVGRRFTVGGVDCEGVELCEPCNTLAKLTERGVLRGLLDVPEGTCVGLLGPNGAGKSTTMRLLTAQAIADEGEIQVLGHVLPRDSKAARAEMGVVPQLDNLDTTLTVEQNLRVFTHLYRIPRGERQAAIERALEMARLGDRRDTRADKLSGGMRRRLLIARALVHGPRLVLLDEPTVGLDPQVRQELWALIDALRAEGVSILMSTHYIEEASRLADTVVIMAEGSAVAAGPPAALVAEHVGREAIEVYGPPARLAEAEAEARAAGFNTRRTGTSVSVLGIERANGHTPEGERRPANLEDLFVLLTGEEAE
jgi:lipooligosaccharide transport system ATP-binding protein